MKKQITPKSEIELIKSIRNDWGNVHPSTKTFRDRRHKAEEKYPKQFMEGEKEE